MLILMSMDTLSGKATVPLSFLTPFSVLSTHKRFCSLGLLPKEQILSSKSILLFGIVSISEGNKQEVTKVVFL